MEPEVAVVGHDAPPCTARGASAQHSAKAKATNASLRKAMGNLRGGGAISHGRRAALGRA
jgi:hypothetical protein